MRGSLLQQATMSPTDLFHASRWLHKLIHLVLPASCALCGSRSDTPFCAACEASHLTDPTRRCPRCAASMTEAQSLCGRCLATPPAFDATCTAVSYQPPVDLLIKRLKFGAHLPLATAFASVLLERLQQRPSERFDLVMPVPLSAERLAGRGFNQATEIARPLARALGLPLAGQVCLRARDTAPQSTLALPDRQGNMRGAFAVREPTAVAGRRILVIDDVMTTGHTLDALAACLKRHGAARVVNVVFARTALR